MFTVQRYSLTMLLLAAASLPAVAQSPVPNLSGTWTLVAERSSFGPFPAPKSRTDVIEHAEPRLLIKRTVVFEQPTTSDLVYAIDGKPHKNTTALGEMTSTLQWEGQTLVMVSSVSTPDGDAYITDRFSLSPDGKTMTVARTISAGGQDVPQTMIFAKQ